MNKNIIVILFTFLALQSCETTEIPKSELPKFVDKIVINSFISNGNVIEIETSHTAGAYTKDVPKITNDIDFVVKLNDNEINLAYDLGSKTYKSSTKPKAGDKVIIFATKDGYQSVNAATTIPSLIANKVVGYTPNGGKDKNGDLSDLLFISFDDNVNEQNFYQLNFYYLNSTINKYIPLDFELKDAILKKPSTIELNNGAFLFTDESFNGSKASFSIVAPFGLVVANPDEKYLIELKHVSSDYYKYQLTLQDYRDGQDFQSGGPFGSAVIVHSNINNGLGIFASSSISSDTLR